MKKLILLFVLLLAVKLILAQVPRGIKYQAVIRDSNGEVLSEQNIALKISILQSSPTGSTVYSEEHAAQTNTHGLVNLTIGQGTILSGDFSGISWDNGPFFIKVELDAEGGTNYTEMGTSQLLSVPYALYSGQTGEVAQYDSDTLFVVKDNDGNVVFAVFPDGAKVYVNEDIPKGPIGGFAVSGRNNTKGEYEVMRVTPDSTTIIVNRNQKGPIGGFAVSGRNNTKQNFDVLRVTPDSTRIYINDSITQKGPIGGFAVSGRNSGKGKTTTSNYMSLTKNNYFIGHEAGKSNTSGLYNSFMGYMAGVNNTEGSKNTLLGFRSGYNNTKGYDNIMIGDSAGFSNTEGYSNIFIGSSAGMENLSGYKNTCIGYKSGTFNTTGIRNTYLGTYSGWANQTGSYNTAIGTSAGSEFKNGSRNTFLGAYSALWTIKGKGNTFLGTYSGALADTLDNCIFIGTSAGELSKNASHNISIGTYAGENSSNSAENIFIGTYSGKKTCADKNIFLGHESGYNNISGDSSIFIGHNAGYNETKSSRLYIENSRANENNALIYGEFDNDILSFNAYVGIGTITPIEKLEVSDGNIKVSNGSFIDDGVVLDVPDYVFDKDYQLESIEEHAAFMWKNKHLPALKSAKEIKKSGGYDISERREQILEELEKAHIYIEQLNKQIKKLKEVNNLLINRLDKLENK